MLISEFKIDFRADFYITTMKNWLQISLHFTRANNLRKLNQLTYNRNAEPDAARPIKKLFYVPDAYFD